MTPKLIIVEGADCTGKTSLAKFIARRLNMIYLHASGHKSLHPGMLAYHLELIKSVEFNVSLGRAVVMDRLWPSEWCYGRVLRAHVSEHYKYDRVWKALAPLRPTYIFCFSDKAHDRQIADPDNDHTYDSSEYSMIYGEYRALYTDMTVSRRLKIDQNETTILNYSIESMGADLAGFCERNLL